MRFAVLLKKRLFFSMLMILITLLLWQLINYRQDYEIISPRLGMPALKLSGQPLLIELKSNRLFPETDFSVVLFNDFQRYSLKVDRLEQWGNSLLLHVRLPLHALSGQYHLQLQQQGQTWQRDSAVFILKKYTNNLRIVQFADLPWLSDKLTENSSGDRILAKIIEEVNLINPDLVLVSGDNAYGGSWGQYQSLYHALKKLTVPLVIVPGNHEYQGWNGYLSFFGKTRHSIDYGDYRIISFNSGHARDQITYSQYHWLKQQFEQAPDKTFVVQLHHPFFGDYGTIKNLRQQMLALFKKYRVQIVFSGHVHADSVYDEQGNSLQQVSQKRPLYAVVTTAGNHWRSQYATSVVEQGYRLVRFDQNKKLHDYSYDADGDHTRDGSSSIPWNNLQVEKISSNHYRVENHLNESFDHARVDFRVKSGKSWKLNDGNIIAWRKGKTFDQIEVEFVLPANSVKEIMLQ